MDMLYEDYPHRRWNALTGDWVLVSPHRADRPWQGQQEPAEHSNLPSYDPDCYLCPGNLRASGEKNPDYPHTFVFTNDFAAILPESPAMPAAEEDPLLIARPETGVCEVICYSPRHDLSMARMRAQAAAGVVDVWCEEFCKLGAREDIGYVQIFENRGSVMGCSNPHPHGQIWATRSIPTIPATEQARQFDHLERTGRCLLCRYLEREQSAKDRIVLENDSFLVLVPFWAVWPFETLILPRRHTGSIETMNPKERTDLARVVIRLGVRYDNLFRTSFPYSMGIHQQPTDATAHPEWHFHIHYYPPLLRSRSVKKFMVGFEMLAMPQRDLSAEESARRLREQSEIHYLEVD